MVHRLVTGFLLAATLAAAPATLAQRGTVRGEVVTEDGAPIAGVEVTARSIVTDRVMQKTTTKKKGTFVLPFLEIGEYRFRASKEGLLIGSFSITTVGADRRVQGEATYEVGALQELPAFRLRSNGTLRIRFTMVPDSYFAEVLVVPGSRDATRLLGEANDLAIAGKHEASIELLHRILDEGDANAKVYYLLGTNAYALGRPEEASRWFDKTAELDPRQPGLHAYLGNLAGDRGDLEQALREFDRELEISPDATVVELNRAILLIRLDRKEEAVEALRSVIDRNPDETGAYSELAALYVELGREQEAAEVLDRLRGTGQADPALWFNIGAGFSNRDLPDQARAAYLHALELDPDFADAVRELGFLDIQSGDRSAAIERFGRYLELAPDAEDAETIRSVRKTLADSVAEP